MGVIMGEKYGSNTAQCRTITLCMFFEFSLFNFMSSRYFKMSKKIAGTGSQDRRPPVDSTRTDLYMDGCFSVFNFSPCMN